MRTGNGLPRRQNRLDEARELPPLPHPPQAAQRFYGHQCAPLEDLPAGVQLWRKLQVPLYKFLRQALVRRFGEDWYQQLDLAAELRDQAFE